MKQSQFFIIALTLIFTQPAFAKFYAEPFLAEIVSGDTKIDNQNGTFDEGVEGLQTGIRFGWTIDKWFLGTEYQFGNVQVGNEDSAISGLGLYFGHHFESHIRVWGTYIFEAKVHVHSSGRYTGDGFKLGVGYDKWRPISINLEMVTSSVEGTDVTSVFNDVSSELILLSLSLPYSI